MGLRTITFSTNEYYHIYNRGVDKRTIFEDDNDRNRFMDLLYLSNSDSAVNHREIKRQHQNVFEFERGDPVVWIGAYCLMPNHFHLLVKADSTEGVTKFVNKLCTGYSMYFNKKYERSGSLFQGRFKAKHADSDEYLKYLFSYIHLNPHKLMVHRPSMGHSSERSSINQLKKYQFSSLQDYFGSARDQGKILSKDEFPEYFTTSGDLEDELASWLSFDCSEE